MNQPMTINKLSAQLGLSSRTLRHWEAEGLLVSNRDRDSGWRVYDQEAMLRIGIIAVLRKLDIPLKAVKAILDTETLDTVEVVLREQLSAMDRNTSELVKRRKLLTKLLESLKRDYTLQAGISLVQLNDFFNNCMISNQIEKVEDNVTMNNGQAENNLRFITLPPMRTVYNIAVGASPEEEAMTPVLQWLEDSGLMGTAKLFGGNVKPFPTHKSPQYGYGMCAAIPENIEIPGHLKEMRLPGGLYAMLPSSEDIYGSWQLLMKYLSQNKEYKSDRTRLCLEEHIRNDSPQGKGSQFMLNLLEPVKRL